MVTGLEQILRASFCEDRCADVDKNVDDEDDDEEDDDDGDDDEEDLDVLHYSTFNHWKAWWSIQVENLS